GPLRPSLLEHPVGVPMSANRSTDELTTQAVLRAALRRGDLFAPLSERALDGLLAATRPMTLDAGATLIEEGDEADSAFFILDGELEILRRTGEVDVPIGVRSAGEIVGEMGMLTNSRR